MSENQAVIIKLDNEALQREPVGSKSKVWFDKPRRLFKIGTENTGENWSEYVTSCLAQEIGLPCVKYQLAEWRHQLGTVCESLVDDEKESLCLGNEILKEISPQYPTIIKPNKYEKVKQYTLDKVLVCNQSTNLLIPIGFDSNKTIKSPIDVFVGYLIFDTWIGNTDRHHQNWAWILHYSDKAYSLAPTFDHASSLGRELQDTARRVRMTTKDSGYDILSYSKKAPSPFYFKSDENKRYTTYDISKVLVEHFSIPSNYWIDKINAIADVRINAVFELIPDKFISIESIEFATKLLSLNKIFLNSLTKGKK